MMYTQAADMNQQPIHRRKVAGLALSIASVVAIWCLAAVIVRAAEPAIVLTGPLQERDVVFDEDSLKAATVVSGIWKIRVGGEGCAAPQQWLEQSARTNDTNVIVLPGTAFADMDVSVRFMPVSGRKEASGGIVFRFGQGRYYGVQANALEDTLQLYVMDGVRRELASARVRPAAVGQWHALRVMARGDHVQAYLNDQLVLDHRDATLSAGGVGLSTQSDSVTAFDGLSIRGTPAPLVTQVR